MTKRPIGIVIFTLVLAGMLIPRTFWLIYFFVQGWDSSNSLILGSQGAYRLISLVPHAFLFILLVWAIVDIFRYKKWAYYFLISISLVYILRVGDEYFMHGGYDLLVLGR